MRDPDVEGAAVLPRPLPAPPGPRASARTYTGPSPHRAGTDGAPPVPWDKRCTMKRALTALFAGAALVAASVGTPSPTAHADVIADWSMQLAVIDTSWSELFTTNFLGCNDLTDPVHGRRVLPGVGWSVTGEITGAGSTTVLGSFAANGIGPTANSQPLTGGSMCEHFNGPIAPPGHEYVATATATVPTNPCRNSPSRLHSPSAPMTSYVAGPIMSCAMASACCWATSGSTPTDSSDLPLRVW